MVHHLDETMMDKCGLGHMKKMATIPIFLQKSSTYPKDQRPLALVNSIVGIGSTYMMYVMYK